MVELFPDQKQLWDAYGHAMGAIGGVELLLRISLINAAVTKMIVEGDFTDDRKKAELAKIQGRTLGQTVATFKKEFPQLETTQLSATPSKTQCIAEISWRIISSRTTCLHFDLRKGSN